MTSRIPSADRPLAAADGAPLPPAPLLLRGGIVVDTEPEVTVRHGADVLITGGRVTAVGTGLEADGAEIVDASGRIVLPGFVDTHRHVWQAVLHGAVPDADLGAYLGHVLGTLSPAMRAEDVHAATFAGALECLDAGITTVQDFSHVQHTPEHGDAAVTALRASGVRAVYGHGYPPFDAPARRPGDVVRLWERHFSGRGPGETVTMALAPAGPSYVPMETVAEDWALAADLGLPIAVHIAAGPVAERPVRALADRGLLRPGTLYVHGNSLPDDELRLIAESGGALSLAPAVEAQMGHGAPMVNRAAAAGVVTGLGVDVVTSVPGDMFALMRAALLTSRLAPGARAETADVLRAATIGGARALGLGDVAGSLTPGKAADIVLVRADALNMLGAAHDPVGALVACAHPGNVDAVLVGGRFVKRDGRLLAADADAAARSAGEAARHLRLALAGR